MGKKTVLKVSSTKVGITRKIPAAGHSSRGTAASVHTLRATKAISGKLARSSTATDKTLSG
jgi:hypothetical protein